MNQKSTMPGLWSVLTAHHDVPVWPLGVPPYKQEGQGGMDLSMHMAKSATDKEPTVALSLRIKPIILHKLTSFFISSSHSFPYIGLLRIERQVRTRHRTVFNAYNQLLADYMKSQRTAIKNH